jgi:small subunit ribosomal protein S7
LKDDTEALQNAPKIIKEDIQRDANRDKKASTPESAASETNAPAAETAEVEGVTFENLLALGQLEAVADGKHASEFDVSSVGHKFGLPSLPLPSDSHLKYRYDPVVSQVTNLLMKDGKLSRAQRVRDFYTHTQQLFP